MKKKKWLSLILSLSMLLSLLPMNALAEENDENQPDNQTSVVEVQNMDKNSEGEKDTTESDVVDPTTSPIGNEDDTKKEDEETPDSTEDPNKKEDEETPDSTENPNKKEEFDVAGSNSELGDNNGDEDLILEDEDYNYTKLTESGAAIYVTLRDGEGRVINTNYPDYEISDYYTTEGNVVGEDETIYVTIEAVSDQAFSSDTVYWTQLTSELPCTGIIADSTGCDACIEESNLPSIIVDGSYCLEIVFDQGVYRGNVTYSAATPTDMEEDLSVTIAGVTLTVPMGKQDTGIYQYAVSGQSVGTTDLSWTVTVDDTGTEKQLLNDAVTVELTGNHTIQDVMRDGTFVLTATDDDGNEVSLGNFYSYDLGGWKYYTDDVFLVVEVITQDDVVQKLVIKEGLRKDDGTSNIAQIKLSFHSEVFDNVTSNESYTMTVSGQAGKVSATVEQTYTTVAVTKELLSNVTANYQIESTSYPDSGAYQSWKVTADYTGEDGSGSYSGNTVIKDLFTDGGVKQNGADVTSASTGVALRPGAYTFLDYVTVTVTYADQTSEVCTFDNSDIWEAVGSSVEKTASAATVDLYAYNYKRMNEGFRIVVNAENVAKIECEYMTEVNLSDLMGEAIYQTDNGWMPISSWAENTATVNGVASAAVKFTIDSIDQFLNITKNVTGSDDEKNGHYTNNFKITAQVGYFGTESIELTDFIDSFTEKKSSSDTSNTSEDDLRSTNSKPSAEAVAELSRFFQVEDLTITAEIPSIVNSGKVIAGTTETVYQNGAAVGDWAVALAEETEDNTVFQLTITKNDGTEIFGGTVFTITYTGRINMDGTDGTDGFRQSDYYHGGKLTIVNNVKGVIQHYRQSTNHTDKAGLQTTDPYGTTQKDTYSKSAGYFDKQLVSYAYGEGGCDATYLVDGSLSKEWVEGTKISKSEDVNNPIFVGSVTNRYTVVKTVGSTGTTRNVTLTDYVGIQKIETRDGKLLSESSDVLPKARVTLTRIVSLAAGENDQDQMTSDQALNLMYNLVNKNTTYQDLKVYYTTADGTETLLTTFTTEELSGGELSRDVDGRTITVTRYDRGVGYTVEVDGNLNCGDKITLDYVVAIDWDAVYAAALEQGILNEDYTVYGSQNTMNIVQTNYVDDGTEEKTVTDEGNEITKTTHNLTVNKVWSDNENAAKKRPVSVEVQLYKDGEAYGDPVTLSEENKWTAIWEGLADDGVYTLTESEVKGYTADIPETFTEDEDGNWTATITNTIVPEKPTTPTPTTTPTVTPTTTPTVTPNTTPTPSKNPKDTETPKIPEETPNETPEENTETPEIPDETPEIHEETPGETPEVTPEIPEETPETPAETPETPAETPEIPEETPETPTETPETPAETPETPTETPETPTETPETPTETPETPTETPDQPTTPTTPSTPSSGTPSSGTPSSGTPSSSTPKTGDESTVLLWAALAVAAGGGLVTALVLPGKRRGSKKH